MQGARDSDSFTAAAAHRRTPRPPASRRRRREPTTITNTTPGPRSSLGSDLASPSLAASTHSCYHTITTTGASSSITRGEPPRPRL